MASTGHSKACCTLPPAQADYTPKGEYTEIAGIKTYKTGPADAAVAIVVVYDIFGLAPQTLQGADLLTNVKDGATVYVPDLLKGSYASASWFPPDTPEKQGALGGFIQGVANPGPAVGSLQSLVKEIKTKSGSSTKYAALGFCWGHKIVSLTSGQDTPWTVAASGHPSLIDAKEAEAISIPFCILASKDEDANDVKAFADNLKGPKHSETYSEMPHGWMAARGDFVDPKAKADYEKAYTTVADFFTTHL